MKNTLRDFFQQNIKALKIPNQYVHPVRKEASSRRRKAPFKFPNKVHISRVQWDRFSIFLEGLKAWNKKINLTSIVDDKEIIIKHFTDSLTLLLIQEVRDLQKGSKVIDIGTGAGFPGIPLKIVLPQIRLMLLESSQKKVDFLKYIVKKLSLDDVVVIWGRAEDYGRKQGFRASFDIVLSRAVSEMRVIGELSLPFLKEQGLFIALKGPSYKKEIDEAREFLKILGGKVEKIENTRLVSLGEPSIERNLAIVRKVGITPERYPRRPGIPQKKRRAEKLHCST